MSEHRRDAPPSWRGARLVLAGPVWRGRPGFRSRIEALRPFRRGARGGDKMRKALFSGAVVLLLLGLAVPLTAQVTSGSLQGTVKDAQGAALPGVAVTASSNALVAGKLIATTDARGVYRFPSLPVGTYVIEAELAGFATVRQEDVVIRLGSSLAYDITLAQAKVAETITVSAEAPVVSVVSNTVASSFDTNFIDNQPLPRNYYAILTAAPGVTSDVTSSSGSSMMAYGGTSQLQNAYTLDGVNVADPGSGEYWLLPSIQWMEEIQIGGLGANAEYGGFTGGIVNGVTKSGGNQFHGAIEYYTTPSSWVSQNDPTGGQGEFKFTDAAISLGGPVKKDSLWYFISGEYWDEVTTPVGALDNSDRKVPRYLGKLTWQASEGNRLMLMLEHDGLVHERRGISATVYPEAAAHEESPNDTFALNWESLINANNFINLKLTGFGGRLDYLPYKGSTNPRVDDGNTGIYWANLDVTEETYRRFLTFDASWTLFSDGLFGGNDSHSFKFGANYEDGTMHGNWSDTGGFMYWDDSSQCESVDAYFADPSCGNYYIETGYGNYHEWLQQNAYNLYAQDSMRLDRFTLNIGLRYSNYNGGFQEGHGNTDVYKVDFVDPRIGLVWDLTGAGSTVVKAHWGRYHQKMFGYLYDREISGNISPPVVDCYWNPDTSAFDECETYLVPPLGTMGKYGHQYVDESLVTFEQQLGKDMLVGLDLVDRKTRDIMAMINTNEDYTEIIATGNPITGGTLPIYDLNSPQVYVLTTDNGAYRNYQSVMLRFNKRYSHGWQLMSSLVWADLKGNQYSNDGYVDEFLDKNGFTNADGRVDLSYNEWEFKLSAAVDLPLNLVASVQYQYMSGMYWQPYVRVSGLDYNWHEGRDIKLVPRGTNQFEARNLIDLRLAWNLRFGKDINLTVQAECFNCTNSSTMLDVYNRWGTYRLSRKTWSQTSTYGDPYTIENPRQFRAGVRFTF
jgi:Carboxypeptidase regulatory-like domain